MDNNIKRTIILDNYENPYNKGLTNDKDYCVINANNESCIDNFDLEQNVVGTEEYWNGACIRRNMYIGLGISNSRATD